ncbi:MAG: hypothetical protein JXA57_11470 [Armatimonadetes bacterium]|nr:hypothetical protein [Armatimonadota bacterium]
MIPDRGHVVAVSAALADIQLAAALYRRLIERLGREAVFFYPVNSVQEGRLQPELQRIYRASTLVALLVGPNYLSSQCACYEAIQAILRLDDPGQSDSTRRQHVAVLQIDDCKLPDCLATVCAAETVYRLRWHRWLYDIDRAAKWLLGSTEAVLPRCTQAKQSTPYVIQRHLPEFGAVYGRPAKYPRDGDILRHGVHSVAALLGTLEQQERSARICAALGRLADVAALGSGPQRDMGVELERTRQAVRCLLSCLASPGESRFLTHSQQPDRADPELVFKPDVLQLIERLRGYLRHHLLPDPSRSDAAHVDDVAVSFVDELREIHGLNDNALPPDAQDTLTRIHLHADEISQLLMDRLSEPSSPSAVRDTTLPRSQVRRLKEILAATDRRLQRKNPRQGATGA